MSPSPLPFRLYLITDRHVCAPRSLVAVLDEACAAGVQAVQLREKDLSAREMHHLAVQVKSVTDSHGALLFINDRPDVARAVEAAGVHLASSSLPVWAARRCLLQRQLMGVSTHSVQEAAQAEKEGADFVCFGPVYHTPSKSAFGPPLGLGVLAQVTQSVTLPVFAIGGVTPDRVKECCGAGAWGVAVISSIMGVADVAHAVRCFQSALEETTGKD